MSEDIQGKTLVNNEEEKRWKEEVVSYVFGEFRVSVGLLN